MNPKRLWATAATIVVLSAFGPHSSGVWAQDETAFCRQGWDWNQNSLGQDACDIISLLKSACYGVANSTIPPIINNYELYSPPDSDHPEALKCECDSVIYSLYMECAMCQGGAILSWTFWHQSCTTVNVTQYSHNIPQGTAIPHWAFLNVSGLPNQTFSEVLAEAAGRDPEATPAQLSMLSQSITLSTTSTNTPPGIVSNPAPTQTNDNDSSGGSHSGAIVGGVVGSVVSLTILAVGAFLYMKRRKQGGGTQPPPRSYSQDVSEYYGATSLSLIGAALPHGPHYIPGDPTTYPAPLTGSNLPLLDGRGQYRGAAEAHK